MYLRTLTLILYCCLNKLFDINDIITTKNYRQKIRINTQSTTASLLCPVSSLDERFIINLEVFCIFCHSFRTGFYLLWLLNFILASPLLLMHKSLTHAAKKRRNVGPILSRHFMICRLVLFCILLHFLCCYFPLRDVGFITNNKCQRIIHTPCIPYEIHPLV